MKNNRRFFLFLSSVVLISGCATRPSASAERIQENRVGAPKGDADKGRDGLADVKNAALPVKVKTGSGAIRPGNNHILKIWTIGDSVTEGVDNGYRNRLWTVLTQAGYKVDFVGTMKHPFPDTAVCTDADHDGHPGYNTFDVNRDLGKWYATIDKPDVALVMAGTNDLAWWAAPGFKGTGPVKTMMKIVDQLLAKQPDLAVIVSTIPPMSSKIIEAANVDRAGLVGPFNQALKDAVSKHSAYGKRLWLADVNAVLTLKDLDDGIHPSRKAHDKVADAWLKVLLPLLAP